MEQPYVTPSPLDYNTVQSTGGKHSFGRYDQRSAPKFTMRAKTSFGNEVKQTDTEPSGPIADKIDAVLNRPPSWTMLSRGSGIPQAADQPGPGEYHQPSTLYGSHPQLAVAGRVPKRTEKRKDMASTNNTPSPQDYATTLSEGGKHTFGRADQVHAPKFTMRAKTSFGNEVKKSDTEPSGPLSDKYDKILNTPPKWTMVPRGSGMPKTVDQPGPGEYAQPGCIYGNHPCIKQPGRIPKTTEQRPALGRIYEGPE
jgi:hypothetical protein